MADNLLNSPKYLVMSAPVAPAPVAVALAQPQQVFQDCLTKVLNCTPRQVTILVDNRFGSAEEGGPIRKSRHGVAIRPNWLSTVVVVPTVILESRVYKDLRGGVLITICAVGTLI